jgi:hypothetical protein
MQATKISTLRGLIILSLGGLLGLSGCGSIKTSPVAASSTVRLDPNPSKIYVAPFNTETAQVLIPDPDSDGNLFTYKEVEFKQNLQIKFQRMLVQRLNKIAPAENRWVDDLPDEGWLVAGEFKKIYAGSRMLRGVIGAGAGETVFETQVYIYDLRQSKDKYVLTFTTGVRDAKSGDGAGSGPVPSGLSAALIGVVPTTVYNVGQGLSLDASRTARAIRDVLLHYKLNPPPVRAVDSPSSTALQK